MNTYLYILLCVSLWYLLGTVVLNAYGRTDLLIDPDVSAIMSFIAIMIWPVYFLKGDK